MGMQVDVKEWPHMTKNIDVYHCVLKAGQGLIVPWGFVLAEKVLNNQAVSGYR